MPRSPVLRAFFPYGRASNSGPNDFFIFWKERQKDLILIKQHDNHRFSSKETNISQYFPCCKHSYSMQYTDGQVAIQRQYFIRNFLFSKTGLSMISTVSQWLYQYSCPSILRPTMGPRKCGLILQVV